MTTKASMAASATNIPDPNPVGPNNCFTYEKPVGTKDQILKCDLCQFWHHTTCEKVSTRSYKFLSTAKDQDGIHWFCAKCKTSIKGIIEQIQALKFKLESTDQRVSELESRLDERDDRLVKLEDRLAKIEDEKRVSELESRLDERFDKMNKFEERLDTFEENSKTVTDELKTYAETVKSNLEVEAEKKTHSEALADSNMIEKSVKEIKDRDRRKLNLVLFNIQESDSDNLDTRKEHDAERVQLFLKTIDLDPNMITLTRPIRLPKSKAPEHADKPRPLRVTASNEEQRIIVLQKLKNLDEKKKEKLKGIFVKKDMTPLERQELANRKKTKNPQTLTVQK